MKKALLTGINGMDGSHLADLLLEKGNEVYGMQTTHTNLIPLYTRELEPQCLSSSPSLCSQI